MNKISTQQILEFLKKVDLTFPLPLSEKTDLKVLANKFSEKATVSAVVEDGKIVSMVAGYTEELTDNVAYISVVATLKEAQGKGYGKKTVKQFLDVCISKGISAVHLYTDASNKAAIALYERLGFVQYILADEPRPDDVHLIYRFKQEK